MTHGTMLDKIKNFIMGIFPLLWFALGGFMQWLYVYVIDPSIIDDWQWYHAVVMLLMMILWMSILYFMGTRKRK